MSRSHRRMRSVIGRRAVVLAAAATTALPFAGVNQARAGVFSSITFDPVNNQMSDTNVGIQAGEDYVAAANIIGSDVVVNGLTFTGSGGTPTGTNWNVTGTTGNFGSGGIQAGTKAASNIANLFDGFVYGGNPAVFTLNNLVVGQTYVLTYYNQTWGNDVRAQTITGSDGGTTVFNEDPGGDSLLKYTFQATSTSEALNFLPLDPNNSFHFYGFSNQLVFNNVWAPTSGNSFNTDGNWTRTDAGPAINTPNGQGLSASFPAQATPTTVTLDSSVTIGHLQFTGANSYTLSSPTGTTGLTLQADPGGTSVLSTPTGSHTIAVPISLMNDAVKMGAGTLTIPNDINVVSGSTGGINVQAGLLVLDGANTYNGATTIGAATLRLGAPAPVGNFSFETPSLGGGFAYRPAGATWAFTFSSGMEANGSAFGAPAAPDGSQAGFVQSNGQANGTDGTISQSITFPQNGSYLLSFYAAGRGGGADSVQIQLDSNNVGVAVTPVVNQFNLSTVVLDNVTAGAHTLTFASVGSNSVDTTTFLDLIQINTAAIPSTSAVSLTAATSVLDLNGNTELIGSLSGVAGSSVQTGAGTLITGNDNTNTAFSGTLSGTGPLIKIGSGTQSLTGSNTYAGGTNIQGGAIAVGIPFGTVNGTNTSLSTGPVNVSAGASLQLANTGLTIANNVTLNGFTAGGALVGGMDAGAGSNSMTGTLTLAATSNVSTAGPDKTLNVSGQVTGPGGLLVDGFFGSPGGLVVLSNATNNYQGDTTVSAGTNGPRPILRVGAANAIPSGANAGNFIINGTLDLNAFNQSANGLSGNGFVDSVAGGTPTLTVGNKNASSTFAGVIQNTAGTVSLAKVGTGTLTLNNANTYSGTTLIGAGTIKLAPAVVNTPPAGAVAHYPFDGNANDTSGNANNGTANNSPGFGPGRFGQAISFNGANQDVSVPNSASLQVSANFTVSAWFNLNALSSNQYGILGTRFGQDTTFDMKVSATGGPGQQGIHADIGNGAAWISTGLDINNLTINTHEWHQVTYVFTTTGAQLYFDGVDLNNATWNATPTFMTAAAGASLHIGQSFAGEFMNGAIDDVYVFPTALSSAQVSALFAGSNPAGNLPSTTPLSIASAATFDLNGVNQNVASLSDSGGAGGLVTNSAGTGATFTLAPTGSTSFSGVIQNGTGTVGLVLGGTGVQALAGANTYTGGTTIRGGTLLANNTAGSATGTGAVTVGDSGGANTFRGKLAGAGFITGPVNVFNGSTISAGNGATTTGLLTLSSTTGNSLADGSNYLWKINNAGNAKSGAGTGAGTAGNAVGWDELAFSSLSVGNAGGVDVIPLQIGVGTLPGFNPASTYQWKIAAIPSGNAGGNGTALAAHFHLDSAALSTFAASNSVNPGSFSITGDTLDVYVSYNPAPEPTSLLMSGLGGGAILLRRRRRTI